MTRAELVLEVSRRAGISTKEGDRIIRVFLETLQESIARGEKITISGFGTFERRTRKATVTRNPNTGELIKVQKQNVATFRAGTSLKEAVRSEQ